MKKEIYIFAALFCVLIFSNAATAKNIVIDPFKTKPGFFQEAGVANDKEYPDKLGNIIKVRKSEKEKGFYIKSGKNWKKHGLYYKYSKGKLRSKITYSYGVMEGEALVFHRNGEVKFKYNFKKGMKSGKGYQYRNNTDIFEECDYIKNEKNGICILYHSRQKNSDVSKHVVTPWKGKNKKHGYAKRYNRKGVHISTQQWRKNHRVGKEEKFGK